MLINLTEKEAIMLVGLLGVTSGYGLSKVYSEMKNKLVDGCSCGEDSLVLAQYFTGALTDIISEDDVIINEDELFDMAFKNFWEDDV